MWQEKPVEGYLEIIIYKLKFFALKKGYNMKIINSKGSIWRKWDLHLHSTASDGKCTPEELVDESVAKGIKVIALTDHHTVNNIDKIKRLGKEKGLGVIAGIEFRTE